MKSIFLICLLMSFVVTNTFSQNHDVQVGIVTELNETTFTGPRLSYQYHFNEKIGLELKVNRTFASAEKLLTVESQFSDLNYDGGYSYIGVIPNINFHFGNNSELKPYASIGPGIFFQHIDYSYDSFNRVNIDEKNTIVGANANIGLKANLSHNFFLDANAGYTVRDSHSPIIGLDLGYSF